MGKVCRTEREGRCVYVVREEKQDREKGGGEKRKRM